MNLDKNPLLKNFNKKSNDTYSDILTSVSDTFHRSRANKLEQQIPSKLYQPCVFYSDIKKIFLRKSIKYVLPFYSECVFMTEKEAEVYLPYFIKDLISKEFLPNEVVLSDGSIDDNLIKVAIAPLTLTVMEQKE